MLRSGILRIAVCIAALGATALHAAHAPAVTNRALRQANVTGGPRGPHPYLLKTVSSEKLLTTGRDYQWSINFPRNGTGDSLHIIALRVEFNGGKADTSSLKTGDGTFGIRLKGDPEEYALYTGGNAYKYDQLPHDSLYFAYQLQATEAYFAKVSRGKLAIHATIYPPIPTNGQGAYQESQTGYAVPHPVLYYSPGGKKNSETWDDYYARKTMGLMYFVRDAIVAAAADSTSPSPFAGLSYNAADGTLRDQNNCKCAILIFHAGSSYLTNGGKNGSSGRDTPGDMIDAFISSEWFAAYQDSLKLSGNGIRVKGAADSLLISEIMMCSETSNQDSLNWGIQGILVNQVARQLGIPDLFSTSSGESAVGAYCIMDFAGYSSGNGFIPPYPSAWIRAFMGWDNAQVASLGASTSNRLKALTTVLDRDSAQIAQSAGADTTILLIPINDHEYYLLENRQRNLSGNDSLFLYDTTLSNKTMQVVAAYPFNVNIDSNVLLATGMNASNVILKVRNNDISIPSAGVLVWHVDENVIRNRLASDLVNADSVYRGVSLVQAGGIQDIGVAFTSAFYQAVFYDYGGAEDPFPHLVRFAHADSNFMVDSFGPYTAPSTTSNDGGKTWLTLSMGAGNDTTRHEIGEIQDYDGLAVNYEDSVFTVAARWDYLTPGWPKIAAPKSFYDPVLADLDPAHAGKELFLLDSSGRLYAWSTDSSAVTYGSRQVLFNQIDVKGDTLHAADTATCLDSIGGVVAMPSAIGNAVFIPNRDSGLRVLTALSSSGPTWSSIGLGDTVSSYVCQFRSDSAWAVGCEHGRLVFGKGLDTLSSTRLPSTGAVCAIAALRERQDSVAVIQADGWLSICTIGTAQPVAKTKLDASAVGPFTLATGDINRDSASEIVVCDARHGLWVYLRNLTLAPGWTPRPSDWPSRYIDSATQAQAANNRSKLPVNTSAPSLVDLARSGYPDIVVGGTNGLYAFNYKGVLVYGWPSYLDNRFWFQRGSVTTSPISVTGTGRQPLVLFSSPTGQNVTFGVSKIDSANIVKGMIWFKDPSGQPDSMGNLSRQSIDTLLTAGDSLVTPYYMPGGFVDAVQGNGKRPPVNPSLLPPGVSAGLSSSWPITTGSSPATAPLAGRVDTLASTPVDLFVPTVNGWVYRFRLPNAILPDTLFWPQTGYDNGRSFACASGFLSILATTQAPITLFSYPNPVKKSLTQDIIFRYQFSGPASNVRLDIFTFSGFPVFSSSAMGAPPAFLTGSYPDYNEFQAPIGRLGPGMYRCRMEATIKGQKYEKFWKLAVTR